MSLSCENLIESACQTPPCKKQRTLQETISLNGIGLFTGELVSIRLCPAKANTGILFQRIDLPQKPIFPAKLEYVQGTPRCTIIGSQGVFIQTVEHILAALRAFEIDNLLIEISGSEVPVFDGSSSAFVDAIEKARTCEQDAWKQVYQLRTPLYWSNGDIHLIALPSLEYRISYTLHYPHSRLLRAQFYSVLVNEETFKNEIAPCRTFSLYEEIAPLMKKGLIKGGSLENALIIKEDQVLNPEGVRFPDEMVRHKILDMIGDLSLIEYSFSAHIIAIRSGHTSNNAFAKKLLNHIKMEIS